MRNQTPVGATSPFETVRLAGFAQQADAAHAGTAFEEQVAAVQAVGQLRRQVAVGAAQLQAERVRFHGGRIEIDVDDRDLRFVAGTLAGDDLVAPHDPVVAIPGRRLAMTQRIERTEFHHGFALRRLPHQFDRVDGLHLERIGAARIGQHGIAGGRVREADRLAALAEQVDHRRAAQQQVVRVHRPQQARRVRIGAQAAQRQVQGDAAAAGRQRGAQRAEVDVEKIEFLGKAEILGQQPVGRMRAGRKRDQRIVLGKAGAAHGNAVERDPAAAAVRLRVSFHGAHEQGVAQRRAKRRLAIDEHAQRGQSQLAQRQLGGARLDGDAYARGGIRRQQHLFRRLDDGAKRRVRERQRRHRHGVGRAEGAGHAFHGTRRQLRAAGDFGRRRQLRRRGAAIHARDRTRGKRPQVMRVQHFEQRFGKLGIIVVDAFRDARIEQRERLDHALDVRVLAHLAAHQQAAGDLRVALGKLARIAAQETQFALIVGQQFFQGQAPVDAARRPLLIV
ncbi:hypothetical protein D3C85_356100 [compost metagenome]